MTQLTRAWSWARSVADNWRDGATAVTSHQLTPATGQQRVKTKSVGGHQSDSDHCDESDESDNIIMSEIGDCAISICIALSVILGEQRLLKEQL